MADDRFVDDRGFSIDNCSPTVREIVKEADTDPALRFVVQYYLNARVAAGLENEEDGWIDCGTGAGERWRQAAGYMEQLAAEDPEKALEAALFFTMLPRGLKGEAIHKWVRGDGPILLTIEALRPQLLEFLGGEGSGELLHTLRYNMTYNVGGGQRDSFFEDPECFLAVASMFLCTKLDGCGVANMEGLIEMAKKKLLVPRVAKVVRFYRNFKDTAWMVDALEPYLSPEPMIEELKQRGEAMLGACDFTRVKRRDGLVYERRSGPIVLVPKLVEGAVGEVVYLPSGGNPEKRPTMRDQGREESVYCGEASMGVIAKVPRLYLLEAGSLASSRGYRWHIYEIDDVEGLELGLAEGVAYTRSVLNDVRRTVRVSLGQDADAPYGEREIGPEDGLRVMVETYEFGPFRLTEEFAMWRVALPEGEAQGRGEDYDYCALGAELTRELTRDGKQYCEPGLARAIAYHLPCISRHLNAEQMGRFVGEAVRLRNNVQRRIVARMQEAGGIEPYLREAMGENWERWYIEGEDINHCVRRLAGKDALLGVDLGYLEWAIFHVLGRESESGYGYIGTDSRDGRARRRFLEAARRILKESSTVAG